MNFWDDERKVERLVKLWTAGHSAQQICDAIHAPSRSAVIGKINRLGLQRSGPRPPQTREPIAARKVAKAPPGHAWRSPVGTKSPPRPLPVDEVVAAPALGVAGNGMVFDRGVERPPLEPMPVLSAIPASLGLTMSDPGFTGCRWPIGGAGADMRFCCAPTGGERYCPHHADKSRPAPTTGGRAPVVTDELIRSVRRYA
mgnify:CR=1 FL=1